MIGNKPSATTSAKPVDYPALPELNLGTERQKKLSEWYENLKLVLTTRFEEISTSIDQINNQT